VQAVAPAFFGLDDPLFQPSLSPATVLPGAKAPSSALAEF